MKIDYQLSTSTYDKIEKKKKIVWHCVKFVVVVLRVEYKDGATRDWDGISAA